MKPIYSIWWRERGYFRTPQQVATARGLTVTTQALYAAFPFGGVRAVLRGETR